MKYEEALSKVENIARQMESGQCDIESLTAKLKEARELIKLCKDKLYKTDQEVKQMLEKVDQ